MKGALAALALGLAAAALAAAPNAPPPTKVFPHATTVETLPNGLRVVLVPHDSPGLVAYYTLVRVGSRDEVEPGHSGFAHLFEHMMFRGTKKFPGGEWESRLTARGVNLNAFTWNDQTVYHFVAPSDALPLLIEAEADRFQNLTYGKDVFQTETKAVLGEYNKSFSNPSEKLEEVHLDLAFSRHTYKHTTIGLREDIEKMPERYEYSLQFFSRFYRPDNCTLFIVGDFDARATFELVKKAFAGWTGKAEPKPVPAEPAQGGERRKHVPWDSPTKPLLMVGYKTPSLGTDLAAAAIQNVLGPYLFGQSSPLYRDLVLGRQLAESLRSQYVDTRDPRLFYWLGTLKSDAALTEVEKAVEAAVTELRGGKVDGPRLEAVKSNLRYGMMMHLETPGRIGEALSLHATPTGDVGALNALYDRIAAVTPAELAAFARKYLVAANRTVTTLAHKAAAPAPAEKK